MTDKRKDEMPCLERYDAGLLGGGSGEDADWWHDYIRCELDRAHDFYQQQWDAAERSPPVPDDVAEAIKILETIMGQQHAFPMGDNTKRCIKTLIRAASTPSAAVQALRDALSNILNVITPYAGTHVDPQHRFAMIELARKALNQPHASLP